MSKSFFIDTTRCTACRGCQIACKEWHGLPAVSTKQRGSHQNPPDLNPFNYKLVRFSEQKVNGTVQWNFFPDQCRHCLDPSCKGAAEAHLSGAIVVDEKSGAVLYTDDIKKLNAEQCKEVVDSCPYNIPRLNEKTGLLTKCNMCIDRVEANMLPACVKTCCTGTMNFGERADMLKLARERLEALKKTNPQAQLIDPEEVAVIYLVTEPAKKRASREKRPTEPLSRRTLLSSLVSPLRRLAG